VSNKINLLDKIYKLSKKVSKDLVYYASGYEDELSLLLSQQLKIENVNFLREVTNYHYSSSSGSIGVKNDRPDFVLMPNKEFDIKYPMIVECKFGKIDTLVDGRKQLLRYFHSHNNSSYSEFKNSNEGLIIYWGSTEIIHELPENASKLNSPANRKKRELWQKAILEKEEYEISKPVYKTILEYWEFDGNKMKKIQHWGY
tara:strand:+ start:3610 stop:4209 length:600 start_codon:yes stop_codon:yes gene_type:complete